MTNHHITCSCNSVNHTVRLVDDGENLYIEVQLLQINSIFKRIYLAIKYILGYTNKYGNWDYTIIDNSEGKKLYHFLKRKYK